MTSLFNARSRIDLPAAARSWCQLLAQDVQAAPLALRFHADFALPQEVSREPAAAYETLAPVNAATLALSTALTSRILQRSGVESLAQAWRRLAAQTARAAQAGAVRA